ncbi:MAG TPA: nucleotidyltransferase domain-containing protein [Ktedonosporobacter sp.]|nr:nucleotidyltransferase domain-containing protein [Ktedonosporobacter sp.]
MSETSIPPTLEEVRRRYDHALASFVAKVQRDYYIVAAILYGSLAYDTVWEKSDIDIMLISKERTLRRTAFHLVEDGINFSVSMETHSNFKARIERSLQGSFEHSSLSLSQLLFTTDESIRGFYHHLNQLGNRDRQFQLFNALANSFPTLLKAEKWLVTRHDPVYSFLWFSWTIYHLAEIEVFWNGGIARREVIQQALIYNPVFFTRIYTDLTQQPKDEEVMRQAIESVYGYLDEKMPVICKPLLDYLAEADGSRSITEINEYFSKRMQGAHMGSVCEWLAYKGVLRQVSAPIRLTEKSQVTLDEAAYYYDPHDVSV